MPTLIINQTALERAVPALKEATDKTYLRLTPLLSQQAETLYGLTGLTDYPDDLTASEATRCICLTAAYRAVPQLDLVVTPTGFGVVSNQTTAPASRERVAALREQLRREASDSYDRLCFALLPSPWGRTEAAKRVVCDFFWCPTLLRRYGIKTPDGAEIYAREARAMMPRVEESVARVAEVISPELTDKLVGLLPLLEPGPAADPISARIIERIRRYVALDLSPGSEGARHRAMRSLLDLVRKAGLTDYLDSATARAQAMGPYQNRAADATFFFS